MSPYQESNEIPPGGGYVQILPAINSWIHFYQRVHCKNDLTPPPAAGSSAPITLHKSSHE